MDLITDYIAIIDIQNKGNISLFTTNGELISDAIITIIQLSMSDLKLCELYILQIYRLTVEVTCYDYENICINDILHLSSKYIDQQAELFSHTSKRILNCIVIMTQNNCMYQQY